MTKKVKEEYKKILDIHGYWGNETLEFLQQFEYGTRKKLHGIGQAYCKYGYGL